MFQKKDLLHLTIFIWISLFLITLFTTYTVVILFIPKIRVQSSEDTYKSYPLQKNWFWDSFSNTSEETHGTNSSDLDIWDIAHFEKVNSPSEHARMLDRIREFSKKDHSLHFNQMNKDGTNHNFNTANQNVVHLAPDLVQVSRQYNDKECSEHLYQDNLNISAPSKLSTSVPYLKNYANPCFCDGSGSVACLPLFYVLGAEQCAADVAEMMAAHPLIHSVQRSDWWHRTRFSGYEGQPPVMLRQYIDSYQASTQQIQHTITQGEDSRHPGILGDASPSMLYEQLLWKHIKANRGHDEPEITTADVLHSVVPQAKLVVVLCDPAEHLYYQWNHFDRVNSSQNKDSELYHELMEAFQIFRNCLSDINVPYRDCLYSALNHTDHSRNPTAHGNTLHLLRSGLYYDFLQDWMAVFPKKQFHVLNYKDFTRNQTRTMTGIFEFLEIYNPDDGQFQETLKDLKYLHKGKSTMSDDIKDLLDNFYESHNEILAGFLREPSYLWRDHTTGNLK